MIEYLSYIFEDNNDFIETFDEAPLWSASFGLLLLKHLELKPNLTILDIGSGAGFPLLELAGRFGKSCKLYGIDPWTNANKRAKKKIKNYNQANVEIIESSAENIEFGTGTIDLIVSNLGINNFESPSKVFKECNRALKPKGKLVITSNINGHWKEFYTIFENTLKDIGENEIYDKVVQQQEHRGTIESITKQFNESGFKVQQIFQENMLMKFLDGSAFLNHNFIKLGWLKSWTDLIPPDKLVSIFTLLENNLNTYSLSSNGLNLTVPMAYFEGTK